MKMTNLLLAAALSSALLAAGCAKKDGALDKAVDSTKDALDVRDHEKAKDAAEDVRDAAKDAGNDVKDATKDAATGIKEAAHDAKDAVKKATDGK